MVYPRGGYAEIWKPGKYDQARFPAGRTPYRFLSTFIQLTTDGTLDLFRKDEPAVESMTQDELTRIALEALYNGLQPILSLTIMDPVFGDRLADYFNSGEYGSLYDYESPLQQYDPLT